MPLHDWTRVTAGTFHDFHSAWITFLRQSLNGGLLPPDYYAMGEQVAGSIHPDVLTLREADAITAETADFDQSHDDPLAPGGGTAVLSIEAAPPRVALTQRLDELADAARRQRRVVIRHTPGDDIVAIIEIVSPSNRHNAANVASLVDKITGAVRDGVHAVLIDLFPADRLAPAGVHSLIWSSLGGGGYTPPTGRDRIGVSYEAADFAEAYVQPLALDDPLPPLPLFLKPGHYVPLPLAETYDQAYEGFPRRFKRSIEQG